MRVIILALVLGLSVCYPANSAVGRYGKLRVDGLHLVSQSGQRVQLRGVSTHGPQWFENCYTLESFRALANDWKADIIRIAMYVNEGGYNTKPDYWKQKVAQYIDWAEQVGLYILIDWHTLTPGDPNDGSYNNKWDFWGYISWEYRDKSHVLYEICNEPNGVNWGQIENYANPLIQMIRSKDPNTIIIVGTPSWSSEVQSVNPLPYNNIMYTLHFYASSHYFQQTVREQAGRIPIFVTEYGLSEASGSGRLDFDNANQWVDVFNGNNNGGQRISFINWTFSDCNEGSAGLNPGSCASGQWWSTTQSGNWVKAKIGEQH